MGEGHLNGMFQAPGFVVNKDKHDQKHGDHRWMNMEDDDINNIDDDVTATSESSLGEYSRSSQGSISSSSDLVDDASSSTSNSSTNCNGPLYELSELMAQLPIKDSIHGLKLKVQHSNNNFTLGTVNIQI
ncbi:uncharacterized protein LOC111274574 isoform X2 [Durio zibethinus]|uniref:Uncharacterized protein LOC111274574 isoform X2 n=1 Tax=Durio zibethinus TaxID=66656 RepID=A0A6P5WGF3_DURZI|nr:uncharacterized protein LOC111274574 isoform X2 [Durio zibethinus]